MDQVINQITAILNSWHNLLIIGVVLMSFELIVTEFFLLWIGLVFLSTGVITGILNLDIPASICVFSVLSMIFLYAGKRHYERKSSTVAFTGMNEKCLQLVGQSAIFMTQDSETPSHYGHIMIQGTRWSAQTHNSEPVPHNTLVKVESVHGNMLIVQKCTPHDTSDQIVLCL